MRDDSQTQGQLGTEETQPEAQADGKKFTRISMKSTAMITRYCDRRGEIQKNAYGIDVWVWGEGHSDATLHDAIDPERKYTETAVRYARQEVVGMTNEEWSRTKAGRETIASRPDIKPGDDDRIAALTARMEAIEARLARMEEAVDA